MKFYGKIGFWEEDAEVAPDVYKPGIVEKDYYGELKKDTRSWSSNATQNDEFVVKNSVEIIADLYLKMNFTSIKYIEINGQKLRVSSITMNNYPRISIELGGVYNG